MACFDTAFHHTLPTVARAFALPRELSVQGVRRYGFHGLSYEYIAHVLPSVVGQEADGRVIVAHLGDGASELLDFVDDVLDDLGSRREITFIRALLDHPYGTGADRQIAIYKQTGSMDAVIRFLMQQTMQGIPIEALALAEAR